MLSFGWKKIFSEDTLYIAVVGPMDQPNGKAMQQGVQLYLDKINREGGIDGKRIELKAFDDQDDSQIARNKATEIVNSDDILAVIGHYSSEPSLSAAKIYQNNAIPAITGSATTNKLTEGNQWYFRTIFNNRDQGAVVANYARKILGYENAYIFFENDAYGRELAEAFTETAKRIELNIDEKHQWRFDKTPQKDSFKDKLNKMVESLQKKKAEVEKLNISFKEFGVLFLAIHSTEALETIKELRRLGDMLVIGADAFSSSLLRQNFENEPLEQISPGYYTDNIYTTSPFLIEIMGKKAQNFGNKFVNKYTKKKENGMITAAMYYDVAMIVVEAIKKMLTDGKALTLKEQRQQVRESLKQFSKSENLLEGITGNLYFDKHGDVIKPIPIGVYTKGNLIPAWYQYQPLWNLQNVENLLQKILDNKIIDVNQKFMRKARVVYTGVDFNHIYELDINNSTYMADFYLWFRFKKENSQKEDFQNFFIDDLSKDIRFVNQFSSKNDATTPMPISSSKIEPDVITQTYHLKRRFKVDFDFHDYPLDKQTLLLQFRHNSFTTNELILVIDRQGMGIDNLYKQQKAVNQLEMDTVFLEKEWIVNEISFFQNTQKNDSTLGNPDLFDLQQRQEYSLFNVEIEIKRYVWSFILKNMLPIIFVIMLGYAVYFTNEFGIKITFSINVIVATSLFHLKLASSLAAIGYNILIENIFYVVYMIAIFGVITSLIFSKTDKEISGMEQKLEKKLEKMKETGAEEDEEVEKMVAKINKNRKFLKHLDRIGRIGYPLVLIIAIILIFYKP